MRRNFKLHTPIVHFVLVGVLVYFGQWTDGHPAPFWAEGGQDPPKLRICGPRIKEAIADICRGKAAYSPHERAKRDLIPRRPFRAVVNDCCSMECKISELAKYCGRPLPKAGRRHTPEAARLVSLQDFLRGLAEFFQQTYPQGQSHLSGHTFVRPWSERTEVQEETLDESEEEETTLEGITGSGRGRNINLEETARDEEGRRSRTPPGNMSPRHVDQQGYTGRHSQGVSGRMEEHASSRGTGIAVIVPQPSN